MIPAVEEEAVKVEIGKSIYKNYYNAEIEYLRNRKVQNELIKIIFDVLNNSIDSRYGFFKRICCDFQLLEEKCLKYKNRITI